MKLKKTIVSALVIVSVFAPALAVRVQAQWIDVVQAPKETIGDTIAWMVINKILEKLTASTVEWINTGFEGSPAYVTDSEAYFKDLGDKVAGQFIFSYPNFNFLCGSLGLRVRLALQKNYLREPTWQCTLSDAWGNVDDFMGDFEKGGWDNFFELTQNQQNNPIGAYLQAESKMVERIQSKTDQALKELDYGDGFLAFKKCVQYDMSVIDPAGELSDTEPVCLKHETVTPGSVINSQLENALGSGQGRLEAADEINEMVSALLNQLIGKIFSSVGGLRGTSEPDSTNKNRTFLDDLDDGTTKDYFGNEPTTPETPCLDDAYNPNNPYYDSNPDVCVFPLGGDGGSGQTGGNTGDQGGICANAGGAAPRLTINSNNSNLSGFLMGSPVSIGLVATDPEGCADLNYTWEITSDPTNQAKFSGTPESTRVSGTNIQSVQLKLYYGNNSAVDQSMIGKKIIVKASVSDGGAIVSHNFEVTISNHNLPPTPIIVVNPVSSAANPILSGEGVTFTSDSSIDPDNSGMRHEWMQSGLSTICPGLPGLVFFGSEGTGSGITIPSLSRADSFTVTLVLLDGLYDVRKSTEVFVRPSSNNPDFGDCGDPSNKPPQISSPISTYNDIAMKVGEVMALSAGATDLDGDTVTFAWVVDYGMSASYPPFTLDTKKGANINITAVRKGEGKIVLKAFDGSPHSFEEGVNQKTMIVHVLE